MRQCLQHNNKDAEKQLVKCRNDIRPYITILFDVFKLQKEPLQIFALNEIKNTIKLHLRTITPQYMLQIIYQLQQAIQQQVQKVKFNIINDICNILLQQIMLISDDVEDQEILNSVFQRLIVLFNSQNIQLYILAVNMINQIFQYNGSNKELRQQYAQQIEPQLLQLYTLTNDLDNDYFNQMLVLSLTQFYKMYFNAVYFDHTEQQLNQLFTVLLKEEQYKEKEILSIIINIFSDIADQRIQAFNFDSLQGQIMEFCVRNIFQITQEDIYSDCEYINLLLYLSTQMIKFDGIQRRYPIAYQKIQDQSQQIFQFLCQQLQVIYDISINQEDIMNSDIITAIIQFLDELAKDKQNGIQQIIYNQIQEYIQNINDSNIYILLCLLRCNNIENLLQLKVNIIEQLLNQFFMFQTIIQKQIIQLVINILENNYENIQLDQNYDNTLQNQFNQILINLLNIFFQDNNQTNYLLIYLLSQIIYKLIMFNCLSQQNLQKVCYIVLYQLLLNINNQQVDNFYKIFKQCMQRIEDQDLFQIITKVLTQDQITDNLLSQIDKTIQTESIQVCQFLEVIEFIISKAEYIYPIFEQQIYILCDKILNINYYNINRIFQMLGMFYSKRDYNQKPFYCQQQSQYLYVILNKRVSVSDYICYYDYITNQNYDVNNIQAAQNIIIKLSQGINMIEQELAILMAIQLINFRIQNEQIVDFCYKYAQQLLKQKQFLYLKSEQKRAYMLILVQYISSILQVLIINKQDKLALDLMLNNISEIKDIFFIAQLIVSDQKSHLCWRIVDGIMINFLIIIQFIQQYNIPIERQIVYQLLQIIAYNYDLQQKMRTKLQSLELTQYIQSGLIDQLLIQDLLDQNQTLYNNDYFNNLEFTQIGRLFVKQRNNIYELSEFQQRFRGYQTMADNLIIQLSKQ